MGINYRWASKGIYFLISTSNLKSPKSKNYSSLWVPGDEGFPPSAVGPQLACCGKVWALGVKALDLTMRV